MEVVHGVAKSTRDSMEDQLGILSSNGKRRRLDSPHMNEYPYGRDVELKENSVSSPASKNLIQIPTPISSSDESSYAVGDNSRSSDLKAEDLETETSSLLHNGFSRETTPSHEDSGDMESYSSETPPTTKKTPAQEKTASSRQKPSCAKMPSAEEIEDFFSVAEKYEQKRFLEKYNYDIVKDVALEGRFQWIPLKQ